MAKKSVRQQAKGKKEAATEQPELTSPVDEKGFTTKGLYDFLHIAMRHNALTLESVVHLQLDEKNLPALVQFQILVDFSFMAPMMAIFQEATKNDSTNPASD